MYFGTVLEEMYLVTLDHCHLLTFDRRILRARDCNSMTTPPADEHHDMWLKNTLNGL